MQKFSIYVSWGKTIFGYDHLVGFNFELFLVEYTIHRQVDGYEWNSYLTWWKKFIPHVMEMNSYLKWWLKIHTRVAVGHEWYEFFTITRGKNSFPSHAVWIFSITRGKNFIHTHPLGDELYSCDVLLIDNMIPKLLQKSQN